MTPTDLQEDTTTPPEGLPSEALAPQEDASHEGHDHHHQHAPVLNPELVRSIDVEASVTDVDRAFRTVIRRYARMARIPGFRAGKVPETLVRSRFAKEIRQEVLESLVAERFREALSHQSLQPVSQPQVADLQLLEGQPLRFTATFEVLPEINVDGYDSVTAKRPDVTLTDDEYEQELSATLERHAVIEPVEEDRALIDGDSAEISFTGKPQDMAQVVTEEGLASRDDANSSDQPIQGEDVLVEIGGKNTLPAFNDALRGSKVGQELTFEAAYPAEFGDARLAGKTVSYDVTVKAIKRKTYPERDEEFAKQLGPYESWADFETKLRERAADRKKNTAESGARDEMLDELIAKFEFPVPETFVQQQIDARLDRGLRALAQQGMSEDAMRQLDFGRLRDAQREQAVAEVKASLLLDRIADRENIAVSDEEMERELLMLSIQHREPFDTLRKRLTDDGTLARMKDQMRREKTGAALYERLAA